jgi:hypothetical protein
MLKYNIILPSENLKGTTAFHSAELKLITKATHQTSKLRSLVEQYPFPTVSPLSKMVDGFPALFIYQRERRLAGRNSLEGDSSTKFEETNFQPPLLLPTDRSVPSFTKPALYCSGGFPLSWAHKEIYTNITSHWVL